jgi:hypothetical protein
VKTCPFKTITRPPVHTKDNGAFPQALKAVASTAVLLAQDALRAQGARLFSLLLCPGRDSLCGPGLKPLFSLRHHFHGLNSLRKKSENSKNIPQRLKPESFRRFFGTAEAVPFQNNGVSMAR